MQDDSSLVNTVKKLRADFFSKFQLLKDKKKYLFIQLRKKLEEKKIEEIKENISTID